eukprot:TRINITY_DN7084_c0_g1_i1.p1 TRINITY_DN7084_c0_g1~~TRINITY_DN7084_c0_g1_i1.p1  ORF type:complete len:515 (-),score=121.67 TRINITY_DN7084_c0_g1_i1:321-1865(-)
MSSQKSLLSFFKGSLNRSHSAAAPSKRKDPDSSEDSLISNKKVAFSDRTPPRPAELDDPLSDDSPNDPSAVPAPNAPVSPAVATPASEPAVETPEHADESPARAVLPPCLYGAKCRRSSPDHRAQFSHEGSQDATRRPKPMPTKALPKEAAMQTAIMRERQHPMMRTKSMPQHILPPTASSSFSSSPRSTLSRSGSNESERTRQDREALEAIADLSDDFDAAADEDRDGRPDQDAGATGIDRPDAADDAHSGSDTEEDAVSQLRAKRRFSSDPASDGEDTEEEPAQAAPSTRSAAARGPVSNGKASAPSAGSSGKAVPATDRSESTLVREHVVGDVHVQVRRGDITAEDVNAVVNAANSSLAHGGGVAGAIRRAGGPVIQRESDAWVRQNGTLRDGDVAVTGAGEMLAGCVIHAVGPIWRDGTHNEARLLARAVWNSLRKASDLQLESISLPAISSGIFGFPKRLCAEIMFDQTLRYQQKFPKASLRQVRFTNFDGPTVDIFSDEFDSRFGDGG